jgi:HEAT repeat protein/DNA-binding CsgD family transcriptional regulator
MAKSQDKGTAFELHIKALLEVHGFQVERDVLIAGNQIDLLARRSVGPVPEVYVVECKDRAKPIGVNEVNVFVGEVAAARQGEPRMRGIFVSSNGFTREAKSTAAATGVTCLTAADLEQGLPLEIDLEPAISRYNAHVVDRYGRLTLYSLKADAPLSVELEKVYVTLTAVERVSQGMTQDELRKVLEEEALTPREARILQLRYGLFDPAYTYEEISLKLGVPPERIEAIEAGAMAKLGHFRARSLDRIPVERTLSAPEALAESPRLVVVGAPGSGKTTLLQWIALTYARAAAKERLKTDEERVPVFVPLRALGRCIAEHADRFEPTPDCLLDFLEEHFDGWHLNLPQGFFERLADEGRCAFLFDGLDEVADPGRRADVARAVEAFVSRYRDNRYVVTSRPAGYAGLARFGADFRCCDVRPFTDGDVAEFVANWYLAVETAAEDNPATRQKAADSAADLLGRIRENDRIRRLVDTPLLLTVVALVHQNRTTLPQRRAELYDECTQMLLGFWDEQKGGEAARELARLGELDRNDKRAILEPVALKLHEQRQAREVEGDTLRAWLREEFETVGDPYPEQKARLFLQVIQERAGLLMESEADTYRFSHLTFQEYLAARAVADRDDYIEYTLERRRDPWWREVVLLAVGHLSTPRSKRARALTSDLVRAIWQAEEDDPLERELEPLLRRNLLLAGQCLADLGPIGVEDTVRDGIVVELGEVLRASPYTKLKIETARVLANLGGGVGAAKAMQALIAALADDDYDVRQAAASSLVQLGQASPEVVQALVAALAADQWPVRQAAASSLVQLGQAAPEVVAALTGALAYAEWRVRQAAASSLGQLGQAIPEVVQALSRALTDANGLVRAVAASSLSRLGEAIPEVVEVLTRALADAGSWDVRQAAASSLGQLGQATPEVAQALIRALTDVEWFVRQTAAASLGQLGQAAPEVAQALIGALTDADSWGVRQAAASSLGQLGQATPEVMQALTGALADADDDVRQAAASSLGQLGRATPEVVQALIGALAHAEWFVRQTAAASLGQLGQAAPEVMAALAGALADVEWHVRRAAASSLIQLGQATPGVVQVLTRALTDADDGVRRAAVSSLGQLGQATPEVAQALIGALTDADYRVRRAAASSLGQLGQAIPELVQALSGALADAYNDVREAAASSLIQLGQVTPEVAAALIGALADAGSWDVRQAAASSLVQLATANREIALRALAPVFSDPGFEKTDWHGRPAYDYAYDALWAIAGLGGQEVAEISNL